MKGGLGREEAYSLSGLHLPPVNVGDEATAVGDEATAVGAPTTTVIVTAAAPVQAESASPPASSTPTMPDPPQICAKTVTKAI